jgi:asparagine synthase (glutamine-hydrolysing)
MASEDRRVWIAYNGEVYNFRELRAELVAQGYQFRSRTDTEVILRLYEAEGPESFGRLNGMFALAIWDGRCQELCLARDRFGIKPLYYAWTPAGFAFASEVKALLRAGLAPSLNLAALEAYLSFLWVPEPETMMAGVRKLPAGHWMRVRGDESGSPEIFRFWRPEVGVSETFQCERDAAGALLDRLSVAVARQTVSDVPVGAFLSGGLDSSAVVALMVRTGNPPQRVHSIGFRRQDQRYERVPDDLRYARRLAGDLGVPYEEVVLRPEVVDLLPKLIWHLDEPMADPAIIPAFLICQAARPYTKVLLSGMGGDEVFGGYRRHLTEGLLRLYEGLPEWARGLLARGVRALPSGGTLPFVSTIRHVKKLLRISGFHPGERYIQACTWMDAENRTSLYAPEVRSALASIQAEARHREVLREVASADPVSQMLYLDTCLYLPGHNLNYTDKMSMAASVEVRVPFLDNDLVDFAFRLPSSLKVRRLTGKYLLRRALEGVLPRSILTRRKTGFAAPVRSWLVTDLREMVQDLLAPAQLARRGLFDAEAVSRMLDEQARGRQDWSYPIWSLLTLELWMQAYLDGARP